MSNAQTSCNPFTRERKSHVLHLTWHFPHSALIYSCLLHSDYSQVKFSMLLPKESIYVKFKKVGT